MDRLKYLKGINKIYDNWNDQLIASYTTEVINKAKNEKNELCLNILKEGYMELYKLISQALSKFENMNDLKIALIGGLSNDDYFRNGLINYAHQNIKNINLSFFIPEMTIQKASAIYAIKLDKNNS